MPEVTDEMVQAFSRVFFTNPLGEDVRAGLAAVLAIVERDYYVGERLPARCIAASGAFRCQRRDGHEGMHNSADGWAEMSWA